MQSPQIPTNPWIYEGCNGVGENIGRDNKQSRKQQYSLQDRKIAIGDCADKQ
jgi:hypothetical protein